MKIKFYKKTAAIGLAFMMGAGLTACGSTEDVSETDDVELSADSGSDAEETGETESQTGSASLGIPIGADHKIIVGYTLEQTGTFENADGIGTMGNTLVLIGADERVTPIMNNGSQAQTVEACMYLGNGYYVLQNDSSDINSCALYREDGEQLIPFEAADISWLTSAVDYNNDAADQRYLKIIYCTGETDDEDEAFFYQTDSLMSLWPDEDDLLYAGYAKIYDTEQEQFVEGVEVTNSDIYAAQACGNSLVIEDEEGVARLYDADGNVLLEKEGLDVVGYGYAVFYDGDSREVYDENGYWRFTTEDTISTLDSTSGYMEDFLDAGEIVLVDIDGNEVLSGYESYHEERYGLFTVENDGTQMLVNSDGEVLASSESIVDIISGYYFYGDYEDYTIAGPEGILLEGLDSTDYMAAVNGTSAFVINDRAFSLELEGDFWKGIVDGMIASKSDASGYYGVFDLFTGTQLLDYTYDDIYNAGDYLYAGKDNTWTIYKIVPVYGE
ncbi:MAG: hypothetical protein LIO75_07725 [Lachnospiraceae bacterium]|nr:hypothetical protein [Lachnospiraceae bacterium]